MAKSRAQRKAEKRAARRRSSERQPGRPESERADEERAQEDTQTPVSGDVAEFEAAIETGADTEDYGEHVQPDRRPARRHPGPRRRARGRARPVAPAPVAPAPSRADDAPASRRRPEPTARPPSRRRRSSASASASAPSPSQQAGKPEKSRTRVIGFFVSCWAELKKVQWPDRDTLVQASAVTLIFVVVMAAYLGALDAVFNWLIKQIL